MHCQDVGPYVFFLTDTGILTITHDSQPSTLPIHPGLRVLTCLTRPESLASCPKAMSQSTRNSGEACCKDTIMIGIQRVHRLMEGYKSAAGPAGRYILFLPQGLCACSLPFLSDDSFCSCF